MSYAIIRNEKLTRDNAKGSYIHNERRTKGHSNKEIDSTRTHLPCASARVNFSFLTIA